MNKLITIIITLALSGFVELGAQDKLGALRTNRQIVTIDQPQAPYYSIQILALKLPPSDAEFFQNLDRVKEYPCEDGYVRYCVGDYLTFSEANGQLESVRAKGYGEAFVVNTKKLGVASGAYTSQKIEIKPDSNYFIQLSAFRFPVYLSFFKEFTDIYEFKMSDKIYRYTTPAISGSDVLRELENIKAMGYRDAFVVEIDRYMPFKIE